MVSESGVNAFLRSFLRAGERLQSSADQIEIRPNMLEYSFNIHSWCFVFFETRREITRPQAGRLDERTLADGR